MMYASCMREHSWQKTDKIVDGDEMWVCSECCASAPGAMSGVPPLTVRETEADVMPVDNCEFQAVRELHRE